MVSAVSNGVPVPSDQPRGFVSSRGRYEVEEESRYGEDAVAVADLRRLREYSDPLVLSSADLVDTAKSLEQLMTKLDNAVMVGSVGSLSTSSWRGWWVAKQDDDAVTLKVPMPGVAKEHVKVWAEQNMVVIKTDYPKEKEAERAKVKEDGNGKGKEVQSSKEEEDADDDYGFRYSRRIELLANAFKMDKVRAEMKYGLLKVTVPRLKFEERKDVFNVTVE